MSCLRCSSCTELIDSDDDPACFIEGTADVILCEPCRDDLMCTACGERIAMPDGGYCVHCYAAPFIDGTSVYDPQRAGPCSTRLWDRPGYREAEQLILAARENKTEAA